jgi:hypothetical protein
MKKNQLYIENALSINVGKTAFEIVGIAFYFEYDQAAGSTKGSFLTEMTIAEATAILAGEFTDSLTLSGSFQNFDLNTLWSLVTGGKELPQEIPDIIFETMTLAAALSSTDKDFSIIGNAQVEWDKLCPLRKASPLILSSFCLLIRPKLLIPAPLQLMQD